MGTHRCLTMRKPEQHCWVTSAFNPMICSLVFQFFPYILLLIAILLYLPSLFWRFAAAPHICSDLMFIIEELDKVYNRAIKAAKSVHDVDLRDGVSPVPGSNENVGQR